MKGIGLSVGKIFIQNREVKCILSLKFFFSIKMHLKVTFKLDGLNVNGLRV